MPRNVDFYRGRIVRQVSCGAHHTILIDGLGAIWSWGLNSHGQCGLGVHGCSVDESSNSNFNSRCIQHPELIPDLIGKVVVDVVCGAHHTLALVLSQEMARVSGKSYAEGDSMLLYSWGCGDRGQLGHGSTTSYNYPKQIIQVPSIERKHQSMSREDYATKCLGSFGDQKPILACGIHHSCFVDPVGNLWMWGSNQCGQLGLPKKNQTTQQFPPKSIQIQGDIMPQPKEHQQQL